LLTSSSPENPRVPNSQITKITKITKNITKNEEKEIVEWLKNVSPTTQLVGIKVKMRH